MLRKEDASPEIHFRRTSSLLDDGTGCSDEFPKMGQVLRFDSKREETSDFAEKFLKNSQSFDKDFFHFVLE